MEKIIKSVCNYCGKEYFVDAKVFKDTEKSGGKHYCCKECQFKGQRTGRYVNCLNCGKEIYVSRKQLEQKNHYCSIECYHQNVNHSHPHSDETKKKISESVKVSLLKSEKFICFKNQRDELKSIKKCPICHREFKVTLCDSNKIYCSKSCYIQDHEMKFRKEGSTGGKREGSSRGRKGWYKGYYCDSSWELAYVIYNLEHEIKFKRNNQGFEYEFDGNIHKFYPDFILEDGTYIEIKGWLSKKDKVKISSFNLSLKVIGEKEISIYLTEYAIHYLSFYCFWLCWM